MSVVDIEEVKREDKNYNYLDFEAEKNNKKLMKPHKRKDIKQPARIITDNVSANEIESWGY